MVAKFATYASGPIWWPNLQLMQVVPSGGHICNLCKWRHMVAKFATNASGAMLLLNLIQVTESISGSVVPLAMFIWRTSVQCSEISNNMQNHPNLTSYLYCKKIFHIMVLKHIEVRFSKLVKYYPNWTFSNQR